MLAVSAALALGTRAVWAQDAQQSQIYANPVWLNPAYAGTMEYACKDHKMERMRFSTAYRNQWGGLYKTGLVSGEYISASGRVGLGGIFSYDKSGEPAVSQTQLTAVASYHLDMGRGRMFSNGVALGVADRRINTQDLVFPDQYRPDFYRSNLPPTQDPMLGGVKPRLYPDLAYGFTYHTERLSAGMVAWHINRPNFSISNQLENLAPRFQAHAAYIFPLQKKAEPEPTHKKLSSKPKLEQRTQAPGPSITAFGHLKYQFSFFSADAGGWLSYHKLMLGTWYRSFPLSGSGYSVAQSQAVVFMAGINTYAQAGYLRFGISYDYPASHTLRGLPPALELTLSFQPMSKVCAGRPLYSRLPRRAE